MKELLTILSLPLFILSTLVMPYGNFNDVESLQAVYNHCLKEDADMDLGEFIGEKLLSAGFDPTEDRETHGSHHHQPVNTNAVVVIQNGYLYRQTPVQFLPDIPVTIYEKAIQLNNTILTSQDFHPGIFHPPAVTA
ncbi:MAG: hypothetical protein NVSMB63_19080 [Sediminibacterium sp.]